jgi:hypothetical protein
VLDDTPPPPPVRRSAPRVAVHHDDSDDLKVETPPPPARRSSPRAVTVDETPPPPARRSAPRPAVGERTGEARAGLDDESLDLSGSEMMRLAGATTPPQPAYSAPPVVEPAPAYVQPPVCPVASPPVYEPQVPYAPAPARAVPAARRDWRIAGTFLIIAMALLAFALAYRWVPWMRGAAADWHDPCAAMKDIKALGLSERVTILRQSSFPGVVDQPRRPVFDASTPDPKPSRFY